MVVRTNTSSSNGSAGTGNQSTAGTGNQSTAGTGNQSTAGTGNQSTAGTGNQSEDIGSIQQLQNMTSGNQELLTNNTSVAPENASLLQGMEKEQYVEPENQSNALSAVANNTQ